MTNLTYLYNTSVVDQRSAHKICNSQGGHLVAYQTLEEQQDVESYFTNQVRSANQVAGCVHATFAGVSHRERSAEP